MYVLWTSSFACLDASICIYRAQGLLVTAPGDVNSVIGPLALRIGMKGQPGAQAFGARGVITACIYAFLVVSDGGRVHVERELSGTRREASTPQLLGQISSAVGSLAQ
jgi:hypothetical protein